MDLILDFIHSCMYTFLLFPCIEINFIKYTGICIKTNKKLKSWRIFDVK